MPRARFDVGHLVREWFVTFNSLVVNSCREKGTEEEES